MKCREDNLRSLSWLAALVVGLAASCAVTSRPSVVPGPDDPVVTSDSPEGAPVMAPPLGSVLLEHLEERMRGAHARLGRGRPAVSEMVWGQLGVGQTQGFTLELRSGLCYTVVVAPASDDQSIDVTLYDHQGEELERQSETGSATSLDICPAMAGRFRVMVRMFSGSGAFAFQVFGA